MPIPSPDNSQPMPTWWSSDTRDRHRTMVHAAPIYRAAASQSMVDPELRHYDVYGLVLRLIEITLEADGLVDLISTETLLDALSPALAQMDRAASVSPVGATARHRRTVERLLDHLRNEQDGGADFCETIFDPSVSGGQMREIRFRLLEDRHHPDGGVTIRPTAEAVNLYLRAFDLDLTSQQLALEALIEFQLAKGAFDIAEQACRDARRISRRYREVLTLDLQRTQRDVTQVDWAGTVPHQLVDAHTHLDARLTQEHQILDSATARLRDLTSGSSQALQVVRIRDMILETREEHSQLFRLVMIARSQFLDAQAQQRFRPPTARHVPDPNADLLLGAMCMRAATAGPHLWHLLDGLVPAAPPEAWSIGQQLAWNLADAKRKQTGPSAADEPDLRELPPDPRAFSLALQRDGERALADAADHGRTLKDTLAALYIAGNPESAALAHYVALRANTAAVIGLESPVRVDPEANATGVRNLDLTPLAATPLEHTYRVGPFAGTDLALTLRPHDADATPEQLPTSNRAAA